MDLDREHIVEARQRLVSRLEEIESQLKALQALTQEREILRQTIWGYDELLKKFEGQPLTGYPDTPSHPGSPLWHGARWVLRREGQPMRTPDIAKRLQELGWKFTSKAPSESLRTILLRKADIFERIPGGKFQLKGS